MYSHYLKFLIISLCVILQANSAEARLLTEREAKSAAVDFFVDRGYGRLADESALTCIQTKTDSRGEAVCYVFGAVEGNGFVIISADDSRMPVIGYSYDSVYDVDDVPDNVSAVIGHPASAVMMADRSVVRRIYGRALSNKVLPTAKWSQDSPFNNLIPGRKATGCVATAMAIIMKYHNWPERGKGTLGDVDFNVAYDWDKMRSDNYKYGYTGDEGDAVALLMSHAAQSILTDFGMSGSSAFEVRVPGALIDHFGYDAGVSYKKGTEMERQEWDRLVMSEIDADRPVLYCGQDVSVGHAFVCDGYEYDGTTVYFHINWGWGGIADGYFASDNLSPQASRDYNFNSLNTIVYNIKPAQSAIEWSPVHLTADGNQVGMTIDVTDILPGEKFTLRAGALKNVSTADYKGKIAVVLLDSDGAVKCELSGQRNLSLSSLQTVNYVDIDCAVPSGCEVSAGDIVRLATINAAGEYLPVASELNVIGEIPAKGNEIPYFAINIPSAVEGVDIVAGDCRVIKGRDYEFKVTPDAADKVVTVKANGFILTPTSGNVYRLKNVNKGQDISIIAQNAAEVVSKRNLWVSAGSLASLVSDTDAGTITDLTLFGTIDVNDFTFMRERMRLERLDLSNVEIAASGANPANAIPANAFKGCGSLHTIILPNKLTTMKNGCFNAAGLRSIEIPSSVSTYEYNIFLNCGDLTEVVLRRSAPAWINWCVFAGSPKSRLVVPVGAAAAYRKAENWNEFHEIVEENPVPVTACDVKFQDAGGVMFTPLTTGSEVPVGSEYKFTVATDDSFGDATVEVYANSDRLFPDETGVYKTIVNKDVLIYTVTRQPEATLGASVWKITGAAGGVGLVTDVINVVPGKAFSIRANALAIPSGDDASMFYAAALTDGKGNIKEIISPIVTNAYTNHGNLPCNFNCMVKDASVREGNSIMIVTSYNKKTWRLVKAESGEVSDSIAAVGNKVIYHTVTMPESVQGASIQGAVTQVVRGMPFSLKVTPVSVDDVITITVNGINKVVNQSVANLSIPAVTEDLDIAIQVNPAGSDTYTVVNVREGELAGKIEQCPERLKVVGVMSTADFEAFSNHASTIKALDLADVEIKASGKGKPNSIPSNAFAASKPTVATVLNKIILPVTLERIEASAFSRCMSLTELTIPENVSYIGTGAFTSCRSLNKIIALGKTPAQLGMNPFPQNVAAITLEVPGEAVEAYKKATYWNELTIESAAVYFNIQIDPTRVFNFNPKAFILTKIPYPEVQTSVTLGLPNCDQKSKDNEVMRPGVAFKLYDNRKDITYTSSYLKYGQHGVVFNPADSSDTSLRRPQNHVIDLVFYYGIDFVAPAGIEATLLNVSEENEWKNVEMWLFDPESSAKPTLYREGENYSFVVNTQSSGMDLKVNAVTKVMTKTGLSPEYELREQLLSPDENGVYTIVDLQGDTRVSVTAVPKDGAVISADELGAIDGADVDDIESIGLTGEMSDDDFNTIKENFTSLKSVDLSGITNESIPDDAFAGMTGLNSVNIPDCVLSVGKNAFGGCQSLENITLPSVSSIGEGAFNGCDNLTVIVLNSSGADTGVSRTMTRDGNAGGIDAKSFAGVNPNCLIFVSDVALAASLTDAGNIIYNGNGTRIAVNDILLEGDKAFSTPGSFRLGDKSITYRSVVESGDEGHWKGLVLPFVPGEIYVDGVAHEIGEESGELGLYSFTGNDSESLSQQSSFSANTPYLVRLNGEETGLSEISFKAVGTSDETVYDVPFTPAAGEIVKEGKNFTLYGVYRSKDVESGDYLLDDEGKVFSKVMETEDCEPLTPSSVYLRAVDDMAPDVLKIDKDITVSLDKVTVSVGDGIRLYRDGDSVIIVADNQGSLDFYDLSGRKITSVELCPGRTTVTLERGVYVVAGLKIAI